MSRLSSEIEACLEGGADVVMLAATLNEKIRAFVSPRQMYLTLFAASIDLAAESLTYVSCGHPDQLLYSGASGSYTALASLSVPVGLFPGATFGTPGTRQHAFSPGDRLCLFTDGLADLHQEDGTEFGSDGVLTVCHGLCDDGNLHAEQHVFERLNVLQNSQLHDDILLLSISARGVSAVEHGSQHAQLTTTGT